MINLKAEILDFPPGVPAIPGFVVYSPPIRRNHTDAANISRLSGAALGFPKEITLSRATSEALERYSGFVYKISNFVYLSKKELSSSKIIPIDKLILYKDIQLRNSHISKLSSNKRIHWVKGYEIASNSLNYIPASLVYPTSKNDTFTRHDRYTSSGLAASKNLNEAISNGLCELLERDSTMCSWFTGKRIYRIPQTYFKSVRINRLVKIIQKEKIQVEFFLIHSDLEVVTMVTILKSEKAPYYSFGSSCKLDPLLALERSVEEAIMILRTQKILLGKGYKKRSTENLLDHVMSPLKKQCREQINSLIELEFLSHKDFQRYINNHPRTLKKLLNKLNRKGYAGYYVDVTDTDLKGTGYVVVRVIVPGLHPLETKHDMLHLDTRRIAEFVWKQKIAKISLVPHPFG